MLHCHDGKADCYDVFYIFSVSISVSHEYTLDELKLYSVERVHAVTQSTLLTA